MPRQWPGKFEFILHGLQGLGCSPEGLTGGRGGIGGRDARAWVRVVGLFVRLCLCRERPPCEGFILSETSLLLGSVPLLLGSVPSISSLRAEESLDPKKRERTALFC